MDIRVIEVTDFKCEVRLDLPGHLVAEMASKINTRIKRVTCTWI